jgi:hypothetical protein
MKMSDNYFLLYGETNTYLKFLVEVLHKYLKSLVEVLHKLVNKFDM